MRKGLEQDDSGWRVRGKKREENAAQMEHEYSILSLEMARCVEKQKGMNSKETMVRANEHWRSEG